MEVEKRRSKGGFLNLFDWNGKSRKKLFANNPEELPGTLESKQETQEVVAISSSKPNNCMVDLEENENEMSSCVTSDDGSGPSRAPGVVARLMGLDSLPTLNVSEPSFVSAQLSEVTLLRSTRSDFYSTSYSNFPNRLEPFSRLPQNIPIERFQTEVLPPRSAKSIPITHHRLLSPIRNPGFVSTKNAAHVMEAAAKIVEASPRSTARTKVSNSSVPLRIRDLKEKLEAANKASSRPGRSKEVGASRYSRGGQYGNNTSNKPHNGSEYVLVARDSVDSEKRSVTRDKGRFVSPNVQAKPGLQRSKSFGSQKEQKSNPQRSEQRRTSPDNGNNILRQNNLKQNCESNKDKLVGKNLVPKDNNKNNNNKPSRRIGSSSAISNKVASNSRTGLRKTGPVANAARKEISAKNVSQKKKSVESASTSRSIGEVERSIKCNVTMDSRSNNVSPESRKPGMDVISFTFNSPLKKSPPTEARSLEKRFGIDTNGFAISSSGVNVIGADSLSALLERKLLELTSKVQLYESKRSREEGSVSEASNIVNDVSRGKQVQICMLRDKDKVDSINRNDSPSADTPSISMNHHWQDREECSGSSNNTGKDAELEDISPESSFELSFESGSFTENTSCANGSKGYSYSEAQSRISLSIESECYPEYSAIDSSDSTPSSSARNNNNDLTQTSRRFRSDDTDQPTNWELEYVRTVLFNAGLAAEDFSLGHADDVIARNLFDRLENEEFGGEREEECLNKLGRKALFDSVNECLEARCRDMCVGTCSRWTRLSPRKDWLVEELYEEISGWKIMADWMLDELVDKDMSTRSGRWVDFDQEAFEEGVEIQNNILTYLVDELVSDLMV